MLQVSNSSNVRDIAALPAKLPAIANGYVIRVGYGMASQYYSWDYADSAWKERAAYGLRKPITNLPVYIDAELLQLEHLVMKGRLAGDADNAPNPAFVGKKLTGLGDFSRTFSVLEWRIRCVLCIRRTRQSVPGSDCRPERQ